MSTGYENGRRPAGGETDDYVAELDIYDYQEVLPDDADLGSTYVYRHENVQIRLTDAVISKLQDALIEEKVS